MVFENVCTLFPSATDAKEPPDTLGELQAMKNSGVFHFMGSEVLNPVLLVEQWVQSLVNGRAPDFNESSGEFIDLIRNRMQFFCRHEGKTGRAALEVIMAGIETVVAKPEKPTLASLTSPQRYIWLLNDDERKKLDEWTALAWGGAGPAKKALTPSVKKKGATEKASAAKKMKLESGVGSLVDSYAASSSA